MKSLTIRFNNKAALNAATTYLTNQTAPFRNSSVSITAGVDVNTGEKVFEYPEETFEVTLLLRHGLIVLNVSLLLYSLTLTSLLAVCIPSLVNV